MNVRMHFFAYAFLFLCMPTQSMKKTAPQNYKVQMQQLLSSYQQNNLKPNDIALLKKLAYTHHIDAPDKSGKALLHLAAAKGDALLVKALIVELGANWQLKTTEGKTAADIAQESFCAADENDYDSFDDCVVYLLNPEELIANEIPSAQEKKCGIQ